MLQSFNNFLFNSTAGLIPDTETITVYGRNTDVDSNTVPESIVNQGGISTSFISTYNTITVASSSALDTLAGTGARVVKIEGLDINFNRQTEFLNMNGTTVRTSTLIYSRVNRILVVAAGSLGSNQGIITVRSTIVGTPILRQINTNNNLSSDLNYTIPSGYTGFLTGYMVNINKSTGNSPTQQSDLGIFVRYEGLPWFNLYQVAVTQGSVNENLLSIPIKLEQKTDIDIRVTNTDDNTDVSASISLILVKNNQLIV